MRGSAMLSASGRLVTSPVVMRSSGMRPRPSACIVARRGRRDRSAGDRRSLPAIGRSTPAIDVGERALAVAGHAGDADDLAGAQRQRDVPQRPPRCRAVETRSSDEQRRPAVDGRPAGGDDLVAAHQPRQLGSTRSPAFGAAGDRRPWRITTQRWVSARTSLSLWRDEDDADALARPSRAAPRTARRPRAGVSTAVGSSRIRMRAPRNSALTISSRCCSPTDRSPTGASGSSVEAESRPIAPSRASAPARSAGRPARHCRPAGSPAPYGAAPDGNAGAPCRCRAASASAELRIATGWPSTAIVAGVGRVGAEQDVHQRGLAGAVLAEQAEDVAGVEREIDPASAPARAPKRLEMPRMAMRGSGIGVILHPLSGSGPDALTSRNRAVTASEALRAVSRGPSPAHGGIRRAGACESAA